MACSTSAKSSIRLINATSFAENLQYLCMKVISKDEKKIEVKSFPIILITLAARIMFLKTHQLNFSLLNQLLACDIFVAIIGFYSPRNSFNTLNLMTKKHCSKMQRYCAVYPIQISIWTKMIPPTRVLLTKWTYTMALIILSTRNMRHVSVRTMMLMMWLWNSSVIIFDLF